MFSSVRIWSESKTTMRKLGVVNSTSCPSSKRQWNLVAGVDDNGSVFVSHLMAVVTLDKYFLNSRFGVSNKLRTSTRCRRRRRSRSVGVVSACFSRLTTSICLNVCTVGWMVGTLTGFRRRRDTPLSAQQTNTAVSGGTTTKSNSTRPPSVLGERTHAEKEH